MTDPPQGAKLLKDCVIVYKGGRVAAISSFLHTAFSTLLTAEFSDFVLMPEATEDDIKLILRLVTHNGR